MTSPGPVVVIGGGVIGLAVAWRAACAGLAVTVCDPEPGRGASWAAAGMLAPVTEASVAEAPLTGLGLESLRRWPAFAADLAADAGQEGSSAIGLRQEGTLAVAFDEDDRRALLDLARVHQVLGLASEWLGPRPCRDLEPYLTPRIRGGLVVPGDWQVDNRAVVAALQAATGRRGVVNCAERVAKVVADGHRVTGVELDGGTFVAAGAVVLAAGAWSGQIDGVPPAASPPVRPVKGEILRLQGDPAQPILSRTVRARVQGRAVYLVPRRLGEIVVGASQEEAGFDTSVRVGAVHDLLTAAVALVPGIAELTLVETLARLRPGTPDNAPILGRTPLDGLVLATGHHRNGMLLTPVTADAVVEVLTDGGLPSVAASFTLGRFA